MMLLGCGVVLRLGFGKVCTCYWWFGRCNVGCYCRGFVFELCCAGFGDFVFLLSFPWLGGLLSGWFDLCGCG